MHFLTPWWWLLLLPLAAGVIILYLLKLRRRDVVVPSTLLWQQVLQDYQANAPFQKLRRNLLLFIQLLLLLLVIAALARPAMSLLQPGGRHIVLVIDASASMQSTDVAPSRFAVAVREGHKLIDALGQHDRMMLVAIGGATRALTAFTSDTRALHDALNRLEPSDAPGDLRGALDLAAGLVKGRAGDEVPSVTVISDGALAEASLGTAQTIPVYFQKVGRRSENVGIILCDVRRKLRGGGYEGLLGLKNFGERARTITLETYVNDILQDAREVTLPAQERASIVLDELPTTGGIMRAAIRERDDLAVDNTAEVVLPDADPIAVVLATPGNLFLETALSLDPTLQVTVRDSVPSTVAPGTILIVDRLPVGVVPANAPVLAIGSVPPVTGTPGETLQTPRIIDWARRHPVLRHLDPTLWHVGTAQLVRPATLGETLLETDAGPLAVTLDDDGRRMIVLGWDVLESDLPLQAGFPILIANSIDWLSGERARGHASNVATGQSLRVPAPAGATRAGVRFPDGRNEDLPVKGGMVMIDQLSQAGRYTITAGDASTTVTANLVNATESAIAPREELAVRSTTGESLPVTRGSMRTEREFWRMLALVALAILCVEWWVFHRRVG